MVIVVFYENDSENIAKLMEHLKTAFPQITSLMYVINPKVNDTIGDLDIMLYAGKDHMVENMDGILFKIGPKSFFQTNTQQALTLYRVTKEFAGLTGNELVYDLYTGTGTIANFVAKDCKKVVGIEYVPEAIEDAWVNAKLNNATNTAFYAGDIKDLLTVPFFEENGYPEIVILDPPRAGIHQDVADALLNAEPRRIVYVSCNPATQARDLNLLSVKYKVLKVQPVDMFPHTHHVENVVLLERV
jgi:23S rRNA (uracil1939-C5)-methyltransferase